MSSVACAVRCRGWRSSSSRTGNSTNGRMTPSGSASSSARSIDASAPRRSPSRSRARASSSERVDRRPALLDRPLPALDDRHEHVDGSLRGVLGQVERGLGRCAAPRGRAPRRPSRRASPAPRRGRRATPASGRSGCVARRRGRARRRAGSASAWPPRRRRGRRRSRPAPWPAAPVACWSISSVPGSPSGRTAPRACSSQRSASSNRPSQSRTTAPAPRAAAFTGSSVHPCSPRERHRLLAELERDRGGPAEQRGRDRQMAEAAELEIRPPDASRELERLLEVAAGVLGPGRPQLRDPEVHERGGPEVVAEPAGARRLRGQRGLERPHRLLDGGEIAATAREREPGLGELELEARPALLRDGVGPALHHREVVRALLEQAVVEPGLREGERQLRVGVGGVLRERLEQRSERRQAAVEDQADVAVGDHARRGRPVARRLRMADRLHHVAVLARTTRRLRGAAAPWSTERAVAARAGAGRRTDGGSGTTSGPRRPRTRTRSRPRAPAGSPRSPSRR